MTTREQVIALWPEYSTKFGSKVALAKRLGVTRQRIWNIAKEEGLTFKKSKAADALALRRKGYSWAAVAKACGYASDRSACSCVVTHCRVTGKAFPRHIYVSKYKDTKKLSTMGDGTAF